MGGIGAGGGARTPPPAGPFLLPSRALAPQPLETQPSSIEQTGHAESEFSSSAAALTSKITVRCSLIVAGPEELEGRPWAPLSSPADSGARAPRAAPGPSC